MLRISRALPALVLFTAGLALTACAAGSVAGTASVDKAAAVSSRSSAATTPISSTTAVPSAVQKAAPATGSASSSSTPKPAAKPRSTASNASGPAVVRTAAAGSLGTILVDGKSMTVYAFTKDTAGTSTCFDACAAAWPALTVPGDFAVATSLDRTKFSVASRPDGGKQLVLAGHPLYYYAGDGAPGETNGQGVGKVWFTVDAAGKLIGKEIDKGAAPAAVAPDRTATPATTTAPTTTTPPTTKAAKPAPKPAPVTGKDAVDLAVVGNLGEVMVGANGHTLYAFTKDHDAQSTCFDACAKAWPPLTVGKGFTLTDELQANGVSLYERPDGSQQLVMGNWPVYYYAGDAAPGDANGQGFGGKWYAVNRHCKLVKTAA